MQALKCARLHGCMPRMPRRVLFKQEILPQRSIWQRANGSIFPNPALREDIKEQQNRNQCSTLPARKTNTKPQKQPFIKLLVIFIVVLKVLFIY